MNSHAEIRVFPTPRFRFSTDTIPAPDRIALWREEFGQKFVRLDMEPLDDDPLHYDATFQMLGDASIGVGDISSMAFARTKTLLQDGNDNIVLLIPRTRVIRAELGSFDETVQPGACLVRRSNEIGQTRMKPGHFVTLALPVDRLSSRLADVDRLSISVVPHADQTLRLLLGYCQSIMNTATPLSADLGPVVQDHLLDLAALAIGAHRDAWHHAQEHGIRAARLEHARAEIRRNACNPDYRMADLVRSMHVSESYIRKILAESGTTFSTLLRDVRLETAWERLTDPRLRDHQIGWIALDCGFNDISYFNRVFHKTFEMTPTECRARLSKTEFLQ
ncbi:helix-turn-helix transcriptional regulator [Marivita sp. S6314]|uniref:AraC family transcriptional regulator n=1 Tax=Marivita sp. S6314 TaxID=2926406 RepID=UPI001FF24E3A|nr:AraC family transcriptional regulator [Marivita sp. S6314]MCK0150682.1 helix-turn-helix transcriptional regulator [Marivita sp. S6314]